ncbi:MAG: uncharacterized protein QOK37_1900 [Thermoanaerobaculia bacterium]|jgi:predicted nucleotidyltransferase|nr:uncharacterized protein [Thermoanaerobaculia bacterium]
MSVQPHVALDLDRASIEAFCKKWKIKELALGSVLADRFRPDSDVDFLVSFEGARAGLGPWMGRWQTMAEQLEAIVGRKVDLVDRKGVERNKNYIKRRHILEHQSTIYVA